VEREEGLGMAGEMTLSDVDEIRSFMKSARGARFARQDKEIEDLVPDMSKLSVNGMGKSQVSELAQLRGLLQDKQSMSHMASKWPASVKKVQRILALRHLEKPHPSSPSKNRETLKIRSPVIEAALLNMPQV
jgi:hypothetical protein